MIPISFFCTSVQLPDVLLLHQSETFSEVIVIDVIAEYEVVVCIPITNRITNVGKGRRINALK